MTNPNKQQGTRWESYLVSRLNSAGLTAERIAEGGSKDAGDIHFIDGEGDHWIIEARHRERLNVHKSLAKAREKAEAADLPYVPYGVAVAWKRLTQRSNGKRRTPDGEPVVVAMTLDTFVDLMKGTT